MVAYERKDRPSIQEIAKHPWVQGQLPTEKYIKD